MTDFRHDVPMMKTIAMPVETAPSTPLNLRLGVVYAPRVETPPIAAYMAVEERETFAIFGYHADGTGVELFRSTALAEAFVRFAMHLRMDRP